MLASERQFMAWLSEWPFQFLGRISYSLYLIHGMIGWRMMSVADAKGWAIDPYAMLAIACSASIVAAYGMRLCIEEPSIRIAKSLKFRSGEPS